MAGTSFFGRSLMLLGITLVTTLGLGRLAGLAHRPQPLSPDPAAVAKSTHFVAIFGNSLFEAALDPPLLARALGGIGAQAQMFAGGGWDALHYYMLAQLSAETLRPGRDLVIIEVSANSLNDSDTRVGALRPEAARGLATLPEAPVEVGLDIVTGALSPLYRYRGALQVKMQEVVESRLARLGDLPVVGPAPVTPAFQLVTAPGVNFRIAEVVGDRAAFARAARAKAVVGQAAMQVGGYKLAALERAVRLLRARGVAVALVATPSATWYEAHYPRSWTAAHPRLELLAAETGAMYFARWPEELRDDRHYWDGHHMIAATTPLFTDALAKQIRARLGW